MFTNEKVNKLNNWADVSYCTMPFRYAFAMSYFENGTLQTLETVESVINLLSATALFKPGLTTATRLRVAGSTIFRFGMCQITEKLLKDEGIEKAIAIGAVCLVGSCLLHTSARACEKQRTHTK